MGISETLYTLKPRLVEDDRALMLGLKALSLCKFLIRLINLSKFYTPSLDKVQHHFLFNFYYSLIT